MIYSCYSGTGKTTLCKKIDGFDLDSSAYSKEPNWAKMLKDYQQTERKYLFLLTKKSLNT